MTADEQLTMAVFGLFALAVVILITTMVYWRLTRPERRAEHDS